MRVLVVGGGGREHALAWKLAGERNTDVVCAPGNAGIARSVRTAAVDVADPSAVVALARRERIDLTVVGPELPLDRGVVDCFRGEGLRIFGPSRGAAQLECSKVFAKRFMARHGVPTARYRACARADEPHAVVLAAWDRDEQIARFDGAAVRADAAHLDGSAARVAGRVVRDQIGKLHANSYRAPGAHPVMRGLDPRIHLLSNKDGLREQTRQ